MNINKTIIFSVAFLAFGANSVLAIDTDDEVDIRPASSSSINGENNPQNDLQKANDVQASESTLSKILAWIPGINRLKSFNNGMKQRAVKLYNDNHDALIPRATTGLAALGSIWLIRQSPLAGKLASLASTIAATPFLLPYLSSMRTQLPSGVQYRRDGQVDGMIRATTIIGAYLLLQNLFIKTPMPTPQARGWFSR